VNTCLLVFIYYLIIEEREFIIGNWNVMKIKYNKIFKIVSLCLIILNLSIQNSTIAASTLTLTDFFYFSRISDSSNIASHRDADNINFSLADNQTLDSNSDLYRYSLDQNYYDLNFLIGFSVILESPSDIQFKVTLESKYAENGTFLEGYYNKICSTSLVSSPIGFTNNRVYRVEFYPNGTYVKCQSSASGFYGSDIEFIFSRANGSLNCLIKAGMLDNMNDKYTATYDFGVNRTLDAICIELSMNSLQCNSFSFDVNKISGVLYAYIKKIPEPTTPRLTEISLNLPAVSIIVSICFLVFFTLTIKIKSKRKT